MREQRSKQPATQQQKLLDQALGQVDALQRELDALRGQMARDNRLQTLGALAAGLAHESNNLLTPIGSYAQLALNNPDNRELAERALHVAAEGASKLGRLNASVLGMLAPASGTCDRDCLASDVVNETHHMLMPLLLSDRVTIDIDVPDQRIKIEPLALQQVLINLINNARQAMLETNTNKRIVVSALENKGFLVFSVRDNGPGVPEAMRGQLFEAFASMPHNSAQAQEGEGPSRSAGVSAESQKNIKPGSGLGLSICKQLIESAGGRICLEASSQPGASFRIELPIAPDTTG